MGAQAAAAAGTRSIAFQMSTGRTLRFAAALTLFGGGMHYLVSGRKEADFNKMLLGGALILISMLVL